MEQIVCISVLLFQWFAFTSGINQRRFLFDTPPINPIDLSCNFEYNSCFYTYNTSVSGLGWVRSSGQVTSNGYINDHTSGHGSFVYVHDSTGAILGDTTVLKSLEFATYNQPLYLSFWRFMIGASLDTLTVQYGPGPSYVATFRHDSSNTNQWLRECYNLPRMTPRMQIQFEVTSNTQPRPIFYNTGFIAIDDIKVDLGYCSGHNYPTTIHLPLIPTIPTTHLTTSDYLHYAFWTPWSSWTLCSATCGQASRHRTRSCYGPIPCLGDSLQYEPCAHNTCKVDGGWSTWTQWTSCSTSCDLGQISRVRTCDNPSPSPGGTPCTGNTTEIHDCAFGPCPTWSDWFDGPCSVSCGTGTQPRLRECSTGTSSDCQGSAHQTVTCQLPICV